MYVYGAKKNTPSGKISGERGGVLYIGAEAKLFGHYAKMSIYMRV